jgi:hypothetical protein
MGKKSNWFKNCSLFHIKQLKHHFLGHTNIEYIERTIAKAAAINA